MVAESVKELAEETSEAEDVADAARDQNDAMMGVAGQMQELSATTEDLRSLADRFDVGTDVEPDHRTGTESDSGAMSSPTMAELAADGSGAGDA